MSWKNQLKQLESKKEWDAAIQYMQNIIVESPSCLDAYVSICYLLMNLLVEEDYDRIKHDYYTALTKKYFDESYAKFSNNPEYLLIIELALRYKTALTKDLLSCTDRFPYLPHLKKSLIIAHSESVKLLG